MAETAPKSVKYQFTKLARLTPRNSKKGAKLILTFFFLLSFFFFLWEKHKEHYGTKKKEPKCLIFDFGWTGWQSTPQHLLNINLPNLVDRLQETKWRSKNYSALTLYNPMANFKKWLSNREKLRKYLLFDSGYTGCQGTRQNLLNIDLPIVVGWLEVTLERK